MIKRARKWIIRISVALTAVFCVCGAAACGAPQQLDMPENLQLDGRMLTWDEVQGADGYAVYVDDQEYMVEDNAFEIPFLAGPKTYQVEVMALGDWKKTKDSVCGEIEYTKVFAEAEGEKDGFHFVLMNDLESYEIVACDNKEGYVEFPDDYLDYPVKKIGGKLFAPPQTSNGMFLANPQTGEYCNKITTGIKLPRYLEEIGDYAFCYCLALQEVVMPDSVTTIGHSAFSRCYSLRDIHLPSSLRTVETCAFQYAVYGTQELVFPNGIESIGTSAFIGGKDEHFNLNFSSQLEKVVIPGTIKKVRQAAFANNQSLKEIEIQTENIEEFGERVFEYTAWYEAQPEGFVYLDKILYEYKGDLPENYKLTVNADVVGIAGYAFAYQENLTEAWLADGVKLLGDSIFARTGLKTVRLPADLTFIPRCTITTDAAGMQEIEVPASVTQIEGRGLCIVGGRIILHTKCRVEVDSFMTHARVCYEGVDYTYSARRPTGEGNYWHVDENGYFAIWE